jgi:2,5-diketo-D-gluconate reductase A
MEHQIPAVLLSNGVAMPQIGLGTWPMNDQQAAAAVSTAIGLGYRLLDTAENYQNEAGVGQGIRDAAIAREQLFVTSKFNRQWHSVDGVRTACENSLKRLRLEYLDLLLIHWPNPQQDRYLQAFEGLLKLQDSGLVRAIGTSNFKPAHLERLFAAGMVPQVNQIQLDPYHARRDLVALHSAHQIITEAWSPIGRGGALLQEPLIQLLAEKYGRTAAQIILRWHTQQGYVATPKSADAGRLLQNIQLFDFKLEAIEIEHITQLDRPDPEMLDADVFGH